MTTFSREITLEKKLRQQVWVIPLITFFTAVTLFTGLYFCHYFFTTGNYWTILPAALMAHAFFIVVVHDGAHKAITRTKFDRLLMNIGASVMLLPVYGELFRKYHLLHHAHTNEETDPLWSPARKSIFTRYRWLYVLFELVPFAFKLYVLLTKNTNKLNSNKKTKQPSVSVNYLVFSFLITACLIYFCQPSVWFIVGTLLVLNLISLTRHWCEHTGTDLQKESNTFWFPLGMGIGNHEAHHEHPHFSWLTMMIGLWFRKKDTHPLKTIWGVVFKSSFNHYTKTR